MKILKDTGIEYLLLGSTMSMTIVCCFSTDWKNAAAFFSFSIFYILICIMVELKKNDK